MSNPTEGYLKEENTTLNLLNPLEISDIRYMKKEKNSFVFSPS